MGRVTIRGVSKRFADVTAVDHLTLEVADEEFLVLLGPSGCGKSTALRMIAGLEEPTEGTIEIGDREVNDVAVLRLDVVDLAVPDLDGAFGRLLEAGDHA